MTALLATSQAARWTRERAEDLAQRFEAGLLPRDEWTHEAHVVVGTVAVVRHGLAGGLAWLRRCIRRHNEAVGIVNSETSGYHETITAFHAWSLDAWVSGFPLESMAIGQLDLLLASPRARREWISNWYSREALADPRSRRAWIAPDLRRLDIAERARIRRACRAGRT